MLALQIRIAFRSVVARQRRVAESLPIAHKSQYICMHGQFGLFEKRLENWERSCVRSQLTSSLKLKSEPGIFDSLVFVLWMSDASGKKHAKKTSHIGIVEIHQVGEAHCVDFVTTERRLRANACESIWVEVVCESERGREGTRRLHFGKMIVQIAARCRRR